MYRDVSSCSCPRQSSDNLHILPRDPRTYRIRSELSQFIQTSVIKSTLGSVHRVALAEPSYPITSFEHFSIRPSTSIRKQEYALSFFNHFCSVTNFFYKLPSPELKNYARDQRINIILRNEALSRDSFEERMRRLVVVVVVFDLIRQVTVAVILKYVFGSKGHKIRSTIVFRQSFDF